MWTELCGWGALGRKGGAQIRGRNRVRGVEAPAYILPNTRVPGIMSCRIMSRRGPLGVLEPVSSFVQLCIALHLNVPTMIWEHSWGFGMEAPVRGFPAAVDQCSLDGWRFDIPVDAETGRLPVACGLCDLARPFS